MFSSQSNSIPNSKPNSSFDEQRWIIRIRQALDEDTEEESDIPVSIFNIPKTLMLSSPDSYTPQQVALGPCHHCRPDLYEMERYKLTAAKRSKNHFPKSLKFDNLVDHLTKFEHKFRACYQNYLDFNGETLAWMMAVDSCFLLEFLQMFSVEEGKILTRVSSRISHFVDTARHKLAHDSVLRDIIMLENQIPLFSLRKVLEFQLASLEEADNKLYAVLMGFCKVLSPFKVIQELPNVNQVVGCDHLLELLYHLIVPKVEGSSEITLQVEDQEIHLGKGEKGDFCKIIISKSKTNSAMSLIKRLLVSKPVQFIFKFPWKIISNLPGIVIIRQLEYMCFSQDKEERNEPDPGNNGINMPPLMEEITIPSVTELSNAGIKFSATNEGISSINFDDKSVMFYLPTIILDVNTEVAMRNLVAYESCNASGPLVFTRYIELMNGIIDTEEDAKFLRERGIILNHLKSDEDVANLWNGMTKSIRLTKVPFLDKVIEDLNKYYNQRLKVKIGKFMAQHVFGSWQSLTLMAAILLLSFMSLQVFCSMFGCARLFLHVKRTN